MDVPKTNEWWSQSTDDVVKRLTVDPNVGLSDTEIQNRHTQHGLNKLPEPDDESFLESLIDAFKDPLALILTFAAAISTIVGLIEESTEELQQAGWIMGIVIFMLVVEYITDRQAQSELDKLKSMQKEISLVVRNGQRVEIESEDVVPGEVLVLSEGSRVPSDARIIQASNATVDEAILTGESVPKEKSTTPIAEDTPLDSRSNMVYSGTYVMTGSIIAVATETGINTEFGKIWQQLEAAEETLTPLQQQLDVLGRFLWYATISVCVFVLTIYIVFQGTEPVDALLIAAALAIAFIPEALGAIIVIALALGVREMVNKHAIIRRIYAAEGLGSVSIICTDKTGTITFGAMTPTHLWTFDTGELTTKPENLESNRQHLSDLLDVVIYCNNLVGPSEKALGKLADLANLEIKHEYHVARISEVPFNSERKMMSTVNMSDDGSKQIMRTKGAPTRVLEASSHTVQGEKVVPLTDDMRESIGKQILAFEQEGYRVFAFAQKERAVDAPDITNDDEKDLVFLGLISLSDPPRPEVKTTIQELNGAGVTAKMITGDSPNTALSISKDIGLVPADAHLDSVVTSVEISEMVDAAYQRIDSNSNLSTEQKAKEKITPAEHFTDAQIKRIEESKVFARVTPTDKVTIVRAMQRAGKLTAMVGDGVNDAAAVKQANIGISMVEGAELTKDVSDVTLTGTYGAISNAVAIGRTILHRARLYIHALLSTNGAEVGLFIVAALSGWSIPLTAVQLLVINLAGDSWLSIALATEKAEKNVMSQPARPADEPVINRYMRYSIAFQSMVVTVLMAIAFLMAGDYADTEGIGGDDKLALQQTAVFIMFMTQKILRSSFTARSLNYTLWQIGPFSNKWTLISAFATLLLVLAAIYVLPIGMTSEAVALAPTLMAMGLLPPILEEAIKFGRQQLGYVDIEEHPVAQPA